MLIVRCTQLERYPHIMVCPHPKQQHPPPEYSNPGIKTVSAFRIENMGADEEQRKVAVHNPGEQIL